MSKLARKPRIALMGEFSAGKSTLSNLLLGARPLPEKVTATRLSPVWMSFGTDAPYRVDVDGTEEQIEISDLGNIPVEETRVVRLFFEADILNVCDLIDFPGISDPNMSSDVWQRMLEEIDVVLWCTHATQAWRQSEAAVWNDMPAAVRANSILLITRFDKLKTERDRTRVLKRLAKETKGLFGATFPISLTDALAAGEDYEAFEESGGIDFLQHFLGMIDELADLVARTDETIYAASMKRAAPAPAEEAAAPAAPQNAATPSSDAPQQEVAPESTASAPSEAPTLRRSLPQEPKVDEVDAAEQIEAKVAEVNRIVPRRVRAETTTERSMRPRSKSRNVDMSNALPDDDADLQPKRSAVSELRDVFHADRRAAQ